MRSPHAGRPRAKIQKTSTWRSSSSFAGIVARALVAKRRWLWDSMPGHWVVRVPEANRAGLPFWSEVIRSYTSGDFVESARPGDRQRWRVFRFASAARRESVTKTVEQPEHIFGDMFDRRDPAGVGSFKREFHGSDSNVSARQLFAYVDGLVESLRQPGYVFLNTIELDVDCGRFPEVVAAYFADRDWDYAKRFFVASIYKGEQTEMYAVGRLTFEVVLGQTARVLAQNGGLRWGASLLVGGVQVPEHDVGAAIRRCPFDPGDTAELQRIAKCAWVAGRNLNKLAVWSQPSDHDVHKRLSTLA